MELLLNDELGNGLERSDGSLAKLQFRKLSGRRDEYYGNLRGVRGVPVEILTENPLEY